METNQFQLRSHEKTKPGGDGTYHVEATYTILEDGKPLGFTEHCKAIKRLNAYPKLVDRIRNSLLYHSIAQSHEDFGREVEITCTCQQCGASRALLRELGEAE